jgi:tRNA dimethylallyltransferase
VKIGLELDREELYQRINDRVLNMIELGLEKEVKGLEEYAHLNALQTVGYSEWKDYFEQKISKEKAIENIQLNTRHYAKRQMTWFKRDTAITWFKAGSIEPKQVLL